MRILIYIVLSLLPFTLFGQDSPDIRFELEDIFSTAVVRSDLPVNPGNQLGVDEISNSIRFNLLIDGDRDDKVHYGLSARLTASAGGKTDTELREAWVSIGTDISPLLKIGKQKAAWGKGLIWTPTDYINNKVNALYLDDPVAGKTMIYAEYPFNSGSITAVYLPDPEDDSIAGNTFDKGLAAMRFNVLWKEADISFTAGLGPQEAWNTGGSVSYPIGSFIVYAEANIGQNPDKRYYYYTPDPNSQPYYTVFPDNYLISAVIGGNRSIGENGFITFELYYDEAGYDEDSMKGYTDLLELTASSPLVYYDVYHELLEQYVPSRLGQMYGYISYNYIYEQIHSFTISAIYNIQDSFSYVIPSYQYTGLKDTDLSLDIFIPAGSTDDGEGSLFMTHSVITVRLKVYF